MTAKLFVYFIGFCYCVIAESDHNSKILLFHGSTSDSYQLIQAERVFDNSNFIKSRPTVLYMHGHNESSDADTVKAIVKAYIQNDSFNILILDWRELAAALYLVSAAGLDGLGNVVATFIQKLVARGYPINKIHLVGHSLGAHLSGYVGRYVKSLSKNSQILPRISGLDPAGPDFYVITFATKSISSTDAAFVDIIHSDAGLYGIPISVGIADFWPNGGHRTQPGCPSSGLCSHQRSVYLWSESVANKGKVSFTSRSAKNLNVKVQMGLNCPVNAQPGDYNLETNAQSPYSKG